MPRKLIAGNWKMFGTSETWEALLEDILDRADDVSAELLVCPPMPAIGLLSSLVEAPLQLGAQNVHAEKEGAHTGDTSAAMLKSFKCKYVIVGHSERRAAYAETNADIAAKAARALENGIRPIVCIGETERGDVAVAQKFLAKQLTESLKGVEPRESADLVIAYEPVWAIGTGQTATADDIATVHAGLRETLVKLYGAVLANDMRLLYGGSVKPDNAAEIMAQPNVDGVLVGGASLKADSFLAIAKAAKSKASK